ncbi:MAG: elongation factor G [Phycisphaeraceae bacterium]|nr:elongation factor G [Phycisphaeraceae bacterium]MCB9847211.1 elongation factor G [Phycisphaeraceae bacterium]
MPAYTTADIRNVTFLGHGGSGKTTLVEHLLELAGVIQKAGSVESKNTVTDYEEEEHHHGHSLSSALVHFDHQGKHVNLIDTPGMPDFIGQAVITLPAVEAAAIVVDATKGVQTITRRMMLQTQRRKLPNFIVINKIDHAEIDLEGIIENIQNSFGAQCLPINLPANGATEVVDVFDHESGEADFSSVAEAHTAIVDQVVEVDDAIMEKYLGGEKPSHDDLHRVFEKALREAHLTPILFTSARTGAGVKQLLDFIVNLCPNPLEGNPRPFYTVDAEGNEQDFTYTPDPAKPAIAHVFKVTSDPFVGKLSCFRVHQGTIAHNSQAFQNDSKKAIRIGHIFKLQGKEHKEIDNAIAGDICAVAKLEDLHRDDTLHTDHAHDGVHLRPPALPKPMYGLGITPKSRGDETKLGSALTKLQAEDPTFHVERIAATKQTVAKGIGELHLRIILEKLKNHFGVDVETEPQKVAYKETISAKAEGHHRHKKQTGGAGQFGEVYLRVEPLENDHEVGFEFVDDTFGGSVPKQFMPAIEKGVKQVLQHGAIAGYPMNGIRVSVTDGKYHPVDSKEVAFITAGKRAFIDAVQKAKPVLMEPFVELEITAPQQYMGDLTGDIAGKRGRVQGTDMLPGDMCMISAVAPLSEVLTYATQLKSITGGAGAFTMDYSHDERTPPNVQQEVVASFKPHDEED